jgi:hypothetical protein
MASFICINTFLLRARGETVGFRLGCTKVGSRAGERGAPEVDATRSAIDRLGEFLLPEKTLPHIKVLLTIYGVFTNALRGTWRFGVGYRCYILDAEDHIVQGHELDCETDAEAAVKAEFLLAQDPYYRSAEVWKAARRVMRLEREQQPFPAPYDIALARRTLGPPA